MPYIELSARKELDLYINRLIQQLPRVLGKEANDGDVNYVITRIIDGVYSNKDYNHYNRALGVLEAVKLEYYRRKVAEYESGKMITNGEVYK